MVKFQELSVARGASLLLLFNWLHTARGQSRDIRSALLYSGRPAPVARCWPISKHRRPDRQSLFALSISQPMCRQRVACSGLHHRLRVRGQVDAAAWQVGLARRKRLRFYGCRPAQATQLQPNQVYSFPDACRAGLNLCLGRLKPTQSRPTKRRYYNRWLLASVFWSVGKV